MENVNMGCTWTWIVMGDFNLVLNMVDRLGGKSINSCELIELPPKGSKQTWSVKQGENIFFLQIDWVSVNNKWLLQIPTQCANFLPQGISDHSPIKVEQFNSKRTCRGPFKYYNIWSVHPSFLEIVKEVWNSRIHGCAMLQVKNLEKKAKGTQ